MIELKTERDFRRLGTSIDECLKIVLNIDYGFYMMTKEQIRIMQIIENMVSLQEYTNKGVRVHGWVGNERKVEIYDYKKWQEKVENSLKGFKL
ncbi:hypothetical protein [Peribacillus phoenicis]|uniref:hypothetical protein n=1 Tax=unclassified Peribacillus TaxID=2675266 RepID=UPI0039A29F94